MESISFLRLQINFCPTRSSAMSIKSDARTWCKGMLNCAVNESHCAPKRVRQTQYASPVTWTKWHELFCQALRERPDHSETTYNWVYTVLPHPISTLCWVYSCALSRAVNISSETKLPGFRVFESMPVHSTKSKKIQDPGSCNRQFHKYTVKQRHRIHPIQSRSIHYRRLHSIDSR